MRRIRVIIRLILFAVIIGGLWVLPKIPFDGSLSTIKLVPESELIEIESFHDNFPTNYSGTILIIEAKHGYNSRNDFLLLDTITTKLEQDSSFKSVSSITNLVVPAKSNLNIVYQNFIPIHSNKDFNSKFSILSDFPDITGKFLSADRRYSLIFLEHESPLNSNQIKDIKSWSEFGQQLQPKFVLSDLSEQMESEFYHETFYLGIISILLVLITFFLFTKRFRGIFLIFTILLFNIAATLLFMWIFEFNFTIHMIILPCLIVVFTFSDLLHILYHQTMLKEEVDSDKALQSAIKNRLNRPLILTSISNLFGFILFFIIAFNPILQDLAIIAISAILIAFISARFMVIPLLKRKDNYIDIQFLQKIQNWRIFSSNKGLKPKLSLTFLLISILLIFGLIYNSFQVEEQQFTSTNQNYGENQKIIENCFFGTNSLEIQITTKDSNLIWDLGTLQRIEEIEQFIETEFQPIAINSPLTIAKRYHRFRLHGIASAYSLPNKPNKNWHSDLNKYGGTLGASEVISPNKYSARIQFGFNNIPLNERLEKYKILENYLAKYSSEQLEFNVIGFDYTSDKNNYSFTLNLLFAWLIGTLLIGIVIMLVLKSVLKGIVIICVNLLPLLIVIYFMPLFGLAINPQSLFLLTILSGLCVDDSIYIMMSKETERRKLEFYPILTTSVVLTSGFLSFGCSNFVWLSPFLWVFLIGMISALILDIFVLPTFKIKESE